MAEILNAKFSKGYPRRRQWLLIGDRLAITTPSPLSLEPDHVTAMLVSDTTGFDDVSVIVPLADVSPLLDKSRIPAPRLATMAATWQPLA